MGAYQGLAAVVRLGFWAFAMAFAMTMGVGSAQAQSDERSITVFDIHQGDPLSDLALSYSQEGYQLSTLGGGGWQSMAPFYATHWREVTAKALLTLDADHGIVFGVTSGEAGEKYKIDPGIILGFIAQSHPRPQGTLSLSVNTSLFGHMTEYPCQGDFGDLGDDITVNCRLAASPISIEDGLAQLVDQDPSRLTLSVSYTVNF